MPGSSETLSPALPAAVEELALDVLNLATRNGLKIATAESCTGGLLASLLTDVEGCSHCFDRGFVAYTDDAKAELLGVPREVLERDGAVSACAAEAMVQGALQHSKSDIALAITGYAGPGGPGEEPGLVFVAACRRNEPVQANEYHFGDGGRGDVRLRCLKVALQMLKGII
jgi:nicotinamide-nucleotide amidase